MTARKKEKPEIHKYLDASTGHITWRDQVLLSEDSQSNLPDAEHGPGHPHPDHGLHVHQYREGFYIHCYIGPGASVEWEELRDNAEAGGYSDELLYLLAWAGEHGCTKLRLDADGETYDTLPVFDWEEEKKTGKPVRTEA